RSQNYDRAGATLRAAVPAEGRKCPAVKQARCRQSRVCKAWARVPAGIANARARSVAAPIANREQQKSTAEGRKCGQLFSVEHEGGGGGTELSLNCNKLGVEM